MKNLWRSKRGTEVMEAAVTIPIMVMLVLAIVQFGVLAYASQMAKEAARHGARVGSVAQDDPAGRAAAAAYIFAEGVFAIGDPQVSILAPGGIVGSELRVRVTYHVPNLMRGFPGLPTEGFETFGEATARQEGW